MSWRNFLIAFFFAFSVVANITAIENCETGCVSENLKIEEHCLFCLCLRRGVEVEKEISLKASVFLYKIPEVTLTVIGEEKFSNQRLKPPNFILLS